jgi:hypothetical protein
MKEKSPKGREGKQGPIFQGIFAPKNAPAWMMDRAKLWELPEAGPHGNA